MELRIWLLELVLVLVADGLASESVVKRQITVNGGDLSNFQQNLGTVVNQAAPLVQGLLQGLFNQQQPGARPWNLAANPGVGFQQSPFRPPGRPRPPPGPLAPIIGQNPGVAPPPQVEPNQAGKPGKQKRKQNCERNPNNPRCRAAAASGVPPELALAPWASSIRNSALELPPGVPSPPGFNAKRSYDLGLNSPNTAFQTCFTPGGRTGRCRFVQHCAKRRIVSSLESLLNYACPIGNDILGVCCSENVIPAPPPPPPPVPAPDVPGSNPQDVPPPAAEQPIAAEPLPNYIDTIDVRTSGKSCGIFYRRTKRVVGGQVSTVSEWMWVAALLRKGSSQRCAGVLIGPRHVLTAASCVNTIRVRDLKVRFGDYNFTKVEAAGRDFTVDNIILHEDFNRFSRDNDIALLQLTESPVSSNQVTVPVCLPAPTLLLDEQDAFAIGFSKLSRGGLAVDVVQEIVLPLWRNEDCQPVSVEPPSESEFCAGYTVGGSDSCGGDSGGPLMLQSDSGNWIVVGISQGCSQLNKPGIFTRISPYVGWIKTNAIA